MINIKDKDFIQNPYPTFKKMRNSGKPFWFPIDEEYSSGGLWLFSTYADAMVIFKESKSISKNLRVIKNSSSLSPWDTHLLNQDGSEHLRLRRLVADYFTIQASHKLSRMIHTICENLLSSFLAHECTDLVHDFATPLPLQIIAKIVGIPDSEFDQIRYWTKSIIIDSLGITDEMKQQRTRSICDFSDYLNRLINAQYYNDGHGLIGYLLFSKKEGNISHDELIGMVIFLLVAGHETTIDLIGNALYLLLSNPDQFEMLKKSPKLIPNAVEEVLRFESPTQRTTFRLAIDKIEFPNFTVQKGEQIAVLIGSANRDETVFLEPDTFNIRRGSNLNLAFGGGLHNCLGRSLAKTEAQIAINNFVKHLSHARLKNIEPVWKNSLFLRGLNSLHIII